MTCDILVIAPHPDDAELHVGASVARHIRMGASVVVIDCSAGECASRGTVAERAAEAQASAQIWGLQARENLGLPDCGIDASNPEQRQALSRALRRYAPGWVLAIAASAQHPDHCACHQLSRDAVKLASIHGYDRKLPAIAPPRLLFYEAEVPIMAQVLIPAQDADVACKQACLACYRSQWGPSSHGPQTGISQPSFLEWIDNRGRSWGRQIASPYAEAFTSLSPWPCPNLLQV